MRFLQNRSSGGWCRAHRLRRCNRRSSERHLLSHPTALDRLHAEYAALAKHSSSRPSADLHRSLIFYWYEIHDQAPTGPVVAPAIRMVGWFASVHRLEVFVRAQGRLPRENNRSGGATISPEERTLATWVRTERTATDLGRRSDYQRKRLVCVPGYRENPLEDRWNERYFEYEKLLEDLGFPPLLSSPNSTEKSLSAWAAKQRLSYRKGTLPARRIRLLQGLPVWTWGSGRG
jgi:hypothetical protein